MSSTAPLVEGILALPEGRERQLLAVAGPPTAGKSTLAAELTQRVAEAGRTAVCVPQDGFHLDNRVLAVRGLMAVKGRPS